MHCSRSGLFFFSFFPPHLSVSGSRQASTHSGLFPAREEKECLFFFGFIFKQFRQKKNKTKTPQKPTTTTTDLAARKHDGTRTRTCLCILYEKNYETHVSSVYKVSGQRDLTPTDENVAQPPHIMSKGALTNARMTRKAERRDV